MEIGLSKRGLGIFVRKAVEFKSDIDICSIHNRNFVDAKDIRSLAELDLGSPLHIEINSSDEGEIKRFEEIFRKYEVD